MTTDPKALAARLKITVRRLGGAESHSTNDEAAKDMEEMLPALLDALERGERMAECLRWLDMQGGLGHDKHARIREVLSPPATTGGWMGRIWWWWCRRSGVVNIERRLTMGVGDRAIVRKIVLKHIEKMTEEIQNSGADVGYWSEGSSELLADSVMVMLELQSDIDNYHVKNGTKF